MRKLKVGHEPLPGIGERFHVESACGLTITVVSHRSGRRDVAILETGDDEPLATVALSKGEAAAVAALLVGAQIELVPTTPS
jgi:K+/H+ antiporter YhaU regulatory subunit KhtT